ncbi:hypothetical protein M3201_15750 [Paenibacillus motobuensis]|uniref:zinc ribbon domain-containing protein n=1 Tax=Paenibacillus TaxID=44249 RepID=UPI00203AD7AC|nr:MULTISPECIES: zinc-ribbon domain-containing protein [Paenibacillus]MCM3041159.1 hypothetical protein [Paenibacillus lutimineralis]MCM3648263.1 hypothetical protein [Paenibacillus motobuensis]
MDKFCENCGAPRREGAKFCRECGQPFPQAETVPVEAAPKGIEPQVESTVVPVHPEQPVAPMTTEPVTEAASTPEAEPTMTEVSASSDVTPVSTPSVEHSAPESVDTPVEQAAPIQPQPEASVETPVSTANDASQAASFTEVPPATPVPNPVPNSVPPVVPPAGNIPTMQSVNGVNGTTAAATPTPAWNEIADALENTGEKKSKLKLPLIIGSILIGLLLVGGAVWAIISLNASSSNSALIYVKDKDLMLSAGKKSEPVKAVNNWLDIDDSIKEDYLNVSYYDGDSGAKGMEFSMLGDGIGRWIKFNKSGTRMFYLGKVTDDGTANLYYNDPSKLAKSKKEDIEPGERVASNVSIGANRYAPFQISESGDRVLYFKNYDEEEYSGSLYINDLKEEQLVDNDVYGFYFISKDESTVMYTKAADSDSYNYDLYIKSLNGKGDKVKIDSDISYVVNYSDDFKKIYYVKNNGDIDDLNYNSLYLKEEGKDKQKLISDFTSIESSDQNGVFYFTRTNEKKTKLVDLVEDDMAESDLKITEPHYSDFEYEDTYDVWGYEYTSTEVDYDKYYEAYDLYMDKLDRDSLRSSLKEEEINTTSKQLFLYSAGKEKELSGNIAWVNFADVANKSVIYSKADTEKGPVGKMKMSEIKSIYDVRDHFEGDSSEMMGKGRYIILNDGQEQEIAGEADDYYSFQFSGNGKKLYYMEGAASSASGTLVAYDVLDGKLSNRKVIDENVSYYTNLSDVIWYYKDVKDGKGELDSYLDGKKTKIAFDVEVGSTSIYPEDNTVLYIADFNSKRHMGSLYLKQGQGEAVKVNDDVSFYNYDKGNHLFYITDYNDSKESGDLWEYRGKDQKKLIDNSVEAMLPLRVGYNF